VNSEQTGKLEKKGVNGETIINTIYGTAPAALTPFLQQGEKFP
jgi:hypothetical protein